MARKSLEEQLAQNQLELEQMRKAFAEKEKALKQKIDAQKKQQAAAYQKKRTHTLCTVAPIAMYLFGRFEDNTTSNLDHIVADFKAVSEQATKEQLEQLRGIFNDILGAGSAAEKQEEPKTVDTGIVFEKPVAPDLPKCEKCGSPVTQKVIDYCKAQNNGHILCYACQHPNIVNIVKK